MNIFRLLKPKSTVFYLNKSETLRGAVERLRQSGFTAVPVIDDSGEYIGTVSEGDFLWHILQYNQSLQTISDEHRIVDIVNEERNRAVRIDVTMEELLERVMDQNFVPVIDDRNTFIGIITRKDIIAYFCGMNVNSHAAASQQL